MARMISAPIIFGISLLLSLSSAFNIQKRNLALPCSRTRMFALQETDRQLAYQERNYTWPIPLEMYQPPTAEWKELFDRRFSQISRMPSTDNDSITLKYNGWVSAVTSAVVIQNFTEFGWGLTRAPEDLVKELRNFLLDGVEKGVEGGSMRLEHSIEIIQEKSETSDEGEALPALFLDLPQNLTDKAVSTLRPLHSDWASIPLSPNGIAYGLRLYRNNSRLLMHSDKPDTHIIASILHLGSSDDAEDWPIVIEDFNGKTTEVVMEVGDLLLYESAKLYHGRPRKFSGSWYCSLFTHYYPEGWDTENFHWEGHYAVPPHWFEEHEDNELDSEPVDKLQVVGTGLIEPDCENGWRGLDNSIRLRGPAKADIIQSPMG